MLCPRRLQFRVGCCEGQLPLMHDLVLGHAGGHTHHRQGAALGDKISKGI